MVFECFADGSDLIDITWLKNSAPFKRGNLKTNGHGSKLTINRTREADSGKYQCRATNADGDNATSDEAELISKVFTYLTVYLCIIFI